MSIKNGYFVFRLLSVLMFLILLVSAIGVIPAHGGGGEILYAKRTATGTGDCFSWINACTLQTALAKAGIGTNIWVKAGTHKPTTGTSRGFTFQLKNGVALYGGFNGTETLLSGRNSDPATNNTILSGDISFLSNSDSYHVVTGATGATLNGFTITAGNATGVSPNDRGGGLYNPSGSSPTLTNLIFSNNSADYGGGMYNLEGSNPTLTNIAFSNNTAKYYGGGMANNASNPTLTNISFSDNSVTGVGVEGSGGGLYNRGASIPVLTNVTFGGNSADYGGGLYNTNSHPIMKNVTFSDNTAAFIGGGIYNNASSNPQIYSIYGFEHEPARTLTKKPF